MFLVLAVNISSLLMLQCIAWLE